MVVKIRICVLILVAALAVSASAHAQASGPSEARGGQGKQSRGLWEFATQRVNASDKDYGLCISEARRLTIDETFGRGLFWSNTVSLGLAACLLLIVIHQNRVKGRRELSTAMILTQYHNALSRAEAQIAEATAKNHALMQALVAPSSPEAEAARLDEAKGQNLRSKSRKNVTEDPAASMSPPPVTTAAHSSTAAHPGAAVVSNTEKAAKTRTPESSDVDLIARINSLQQQLNTAQEREKQLRRQLNTSELRFQKEQQKIQTMKNQ